MKFILIMILTVNGGPAGNRWDQPAMATATFDDRAACENAAVAVRKFDQLRGMDAKGQAVCVPASTAP